MDVVTHFTLLTRDSKAGAVSLQTATAHKFRITGPAHLSLPH